MVALLVILTFVFLILWLVFSHVPTPAWVRELFMFLWAFCVTLLASGIGINID